jgi:hypothetical protein
MEGHRKRLRAVQDWLNDVEYRIDVAIIEARRQIGRAEDLLDRIDAARTARQRTAGKLTTAPTPGRPPRPVSRGSSGC